MGRTSRLVVYWNGRVNGGAQRQMDEHTMNDAYRRRLSALPNPQARSIEGLTVE